MSEREQENLEAEVIDPPSSEGGSENPAALSGAEVQPLDPPDGNGGGGGGKVTTVSSS
jgi:hypothetical protein